MKPPKLGRAPVKHDMRTLQLAKYLDPAKLPPMPASIENSPNLSDWGMMGNDMIGDCTCAAAGHQVMSWSTDVGETYYPTEGDIIRAYSAITGYKPGYPETDNGASCLDVLNYWRRVGVAGHKIASFVQINMRNSKEVEAAIYLFGGVYIGVALPFSAQNQPNRWSMGPNLEGDYLPGSWGGHCIPGIGYSKTGIDLITWGEKITMSWNFWYSYVEEAYAIISPDFFNAGKAANGFDLATLEADLKKI